MKKLRTIAERIFLGRDTGNLISRFQDHLIMAAPLLLASGAGTSMLGAADHLAKTGHPLPFTPALSVFTAAAMTASIVVVGYLIATGAFLAVLSIFVKNSKADAT